MTHNSVSIFTDGASRGNPGPGGFGAIIVAPKNYELGIMNFEVKELGGGEKHTTNNRMELTAAIEGLRGSTSNRERGRTSETVVYTDSSYLINGITKWVFGWQKNGWKTADKKDVENRDLWEKLISAAESKKIEWKKIDGHSGIAGNERCDEIATSFVDGKDPELYSGVLKNYRIKNILEVTKGQTSGSEKGSILKTLKRQRSKAKPYSYVSMVNGVIQTYKTWTECEKRVKGARGAKYQKVFSLEEETALIKNWQ